MLQNLLRIYYGLRLTYFILVVLFHFLVNLLAYLYLIKLALLKNTILIAYFGFVILRYTPSFILLHAFLFISLISSQTSNILYILLLILTSGSINLTLKFLCQCIFFIIVQYIFVVIAIFV